MIVSLVKGNVTPLESFEARTSRAQAEVSQNLIVHNDTKLQHAYQGLPEFRSPEALQALELCLTPTAPTACAEARAGVCKCLVSTGRPSGIVVVFCHRELRVDGHGHKVRRMERKFLFHSGVF